jgi:hypothetical protein
MGRKHVFFLLAPRPSFFLDGFRIVQGLNESFIDETTDFWDEFTPGICEVAGATVGRNGLAPAVPYVKVWFHPP